MFICHCYYYGGLFACSAYLPCEILFFFYASLFTATRSLTVSLLLQIRPSVITDLVCILVYCKIPIPLNLLSYFHCLQNTVSPTSSRASLSLFLFFFPVVSIFSTFFGHLISVIIFACANHVKCFLSMSFTMFSFMSSVCLICWFLTLYSLDMLKLLLRQAIFCIK